jgi:hypothetical protein
MKKLLVVLLSLGLIVAFSMTAAAQPSVKFSGQYYVVGFYEDNRSFAGSPNNYSKAAFWTRTRIQSEFQIAEGLKFVTRFDAFEKQWGGTNRSSGATEDKSNSGQQNAGVTLQENLEMEYGYVDFQTRIGQFKVGYQAANEWGTVFGDVPGSRPAALYVGTFGPFNLLLKLEKGFEADTTRLTETPSRITDGDSDYYYLGGVFNWKGGNAGLMMVYSDLRQTRPTSNFVTQVYSFIPYLKATFGPVYVESEFWYITGKARKYDNASQGTDVDKEGIGAYVLAKVNLGPAYFGGQMGYSSGDPSNTTKDKSGPRSTTTWVPTLLFANHNLSSWNYGGYQGTGTAGGGTGGYNSGKQNLWLWNAFGGVNITPKINIEVAFSYMYADNKPTNYVSNTYGTEADIKATYKIYDNLSYMVGAGYLWTGDYFKGTNSANKIGDDYLLMNQLTLNF